MMIINSSINHGVKTRILHIHRTSFFTLVGDASQSVRFEGEVDEADIGDVLYGWPSSSVPVCFTPSHECA